MTTSDLQSVQDQLGGLEDRIGELENGVAAGGATGAAAGARTSPHHPSGHHDQRRGQRRRHLEQHRSAFRVGGDSGASVAVLSGSAPAGLDADDTVRITGTVKRIVRDAFEQDLGLAEDEMFEDVDGFFDEFEGQLGITATEFEVLQAQSG